MDKSPLESKLLSTGVSFLKSNHSSTLTSHAHECVPIARVHSREVLRCRAASFPVMVPDISTEMVKENELRKVASQILHANDPNIFKK